MKLRRHPGRNSDRNLGQKYLLELCAGCNTGTGVVTKELNVADIGCDEGSSVLQRRHVEGILRRSIRVERAALLLPKSDAPPYGRFVIPYSYRKIIVCTAPFLLLADDQISLTPSEIHVRVKSLGANSVRVSGITSFSLKESGD